MIDLRLPSWPHTIRVDSLYATRTYGGWLEGLPDEDANRRLIDAAIIQVASLWGDNRPIHVIPPEVDRRDPAHPKLPEVRVMAWLDCLGHPVRDQRDDGSHLFVIWFQKYGMLDAQSIHRALCELDWKAHAKDFGV